MSNLKRNTLSAAIVLAVGVGLPLTAMAGGAVTPSTQNAFAHEVTGGTTPNPTATVTTMGFNVVAPDILIGRTNTSGDITVFVEFSGGNVSATPTIAVPAGQGTLNAGSVTFANNNLQFTITPPGTPGIQPGQLFGITNLALQDALGLRSGGTGIRATVRVADTNTAIVLLPNTTGTVLSAAYGSSTTFDPKVTHTIDVTQPSQKRQFLISSVNQTWAQIGKVTFAQNDVDAGTSGVQIASADGSGATTNVGLSNEFVFDPAADTGKLTLTVPNAAAFTGTGSVGFWASQGACAATFTAGPTTVKFVVDPNDATKFNATVPIDTSTGQMYNLCAVANGTTPIANQTISATARIDLAGALTIDPPAVSADIAMLVFNGTVVEVATFNPAGNTTQESFLRIINPSNVDGLVTIEGWDDMGTPGASSITFTLGAGKSQQINSGDVENGNAAKGLTGAFGDGVGKWRLVVTGEFAGMVVSSLNRNNNDGTLSNISATSNDADSLGTD